MAASVPAASLVSRSARPDLGLPPTVIHAPVIVTDFPQDAAESRSRSWAVPRRAQQDTHVLDRTSAPRQAAADAQGLLRHSDSVTRVLPIGHPQPRTVGNCDGSGGGRRYGAGASAGCAPSLVGSVGAGAAVAGHGSGPGAAWPRFRGGRPGAAGRRG